MNPSSPNSTPSPQTGEPRPGRYSHPLALYFAATRPAFLTVTLVACLIGLASAHAGGVSINALTATATVLFALVAHAGVNVINDYHDARNGADAANTARLFPFTGGSRFIQNGVLSAAQTGRFGYLLLASVVPAGLWLSWHSGPGLVAIGLAGLFFGWAYSAPPLALMSRGLGELAIAGGWLMVVIGTDYVQRGYFDSLPLLAGVSYALLVANLLFINQFPDRDGDALAGKRTLVVRLGAERAKWGYLIISLIAYAWLIGLAGEGHLPQKAGIAAFTLVLSLTAGRDLIEHAGDPQALRPAIKRTILAAHLHGLLLAVSLALFSGTSAS